MSVLQLKKANCRDCYKCIRSCPIKSIEVVDHQAQIIENDCVLCGSCVLACPQNAKEVRNDVGKVKELLAGELPVIASVAPSFIADFAVSGIGEFRESLQKLGLCYYFLLLPYGVEAHPKILSGADREYRPSGHAHAGPREALEIPTRMPGGFHWPLHFQEGRGGRKGFRCGRGFNL